MDFPISYIVFLYFLSFWTAQATSWNILSGYSGYFSFGQAAFFGVGVYTSAALVTRFEWNHFATIPVAGLMSLLLALAVGGVAFRIGSLRGEIFALLTLVVSFILATVARLSPFIDGGQGRTIEVPEYPEFLGEFSDMVYRLGVLVAVIAVGAAYAIQHSRFGWGLFVIRDREDVAEAFGVPTFRYKMLAIAVSGFLAGASGSVFALQVGFITIEQVFGLTVPLLVIVMSVLGGRSHWLGPVVGAIVVFTLQDRLSSAGLERWNQIIIGAILVVLVIFVSEGLYERGRARWLPAVAAFVVVAAVLGVMGAAGGLVDVFAFGLGAAVLTLFIPFDRLWRRSRRQAETGEGGEPAETREGGETGERPADLEAARVETPEMAPAERGANKEPRVMLAASGVSKSFGGVRALDNVDLEVRAGEIVGLVGPNGSGKSTLINVLSGWYRPTRGDVSFEQRDIVRAPAHEIVGLGIARTYQIPQPFPSLTVRDNVAVSLMFGRSGLSLEEAREEAWQFLEFCGIGQLADALPSKVNLHQRKFLELARALATRPRLLMLDEVMAGLNRTEVDESVAMVRKVHDSGVTLVVVEHLMRVVTQLATRIVVLNRGRVLADGAPQEVMGREEVVEAYLGKGTSAP